MPMSIFTEKDSNKMFERLIQMGLSDDRIIGGALVGSSANDTKDKWSDLDITFGLKKEIDPRFVLDEWISILNKEYTIVHYFDVHRSLGIYRVMLFPNGLEVDLSMVPEEEYGPKSSDFKLIFGRIGENKNNLKSHSVEELFGWGWHHILHANSAIHRKKFGQAEFWINNLRNYVFELQCIRFGLPAVHGRGIHLLPKHFNKAMQYTLIKSLSSSELKRSLHLTTKIFLSEINYSNSELSEKLYLIFQKVLKL